MRAATTFLAATCVAAANLAAQDASPYVPLGHWAMPYVEQLIATGAIADPTPLTRPLRRADLRRALAAADTTALPPAARATVRRLLREFTPREPAAHYRAEWSGGLAAASYAFRDPLELDRGVPPRRAVARGSARASLELALAFGPLVAVSHPAVDSRLQFDPDWYGKADNATRFEEAYASAQWRHGEVFFGILDRNWGPSGVQGLLFSDNPYGLDHLYAAFGSDRVRVQVVAAQLDTRPDSSGALVNRYLSLTRVWARPRGRWTFAAWQGAVWSGVGRQFEPWYLNPATWVYIRSSNSGTNVNAFVGLDVERHARTTLFGQFLLDDIQVSRKAPGDLKPASYGLTLGAKGGVRGGAAAWTLFYTQVANLTYRNEDDLQVPLYHLLGTGRNFADYDQATLKVDALVRPGLLLTPEVTVLRQGEGDPRLLHPLVPDYPATATLFQGVVTRTVRLALGGSWQYRGLSVTGNGGVHLVRNAGHVRGASATRWLGAIGVRYALAFENALP
jgi:hypothetical protein